LQVSLREFTGGAHRRGRSWSARALAIVVAAGGLGVCAAPALGGVVSQSERPTIKARGLSAAERRALAITSVIAVDDQSLGLIVTVSFKGDVARYLGQDRLAGGLLALVLVPAAHAPGQVPTGLVDVGGGYANVPVPLLTRTGARPAVKRGKESVFTPERVLSMGARAPVQVVRDGNRMIFYLGNPGTSPVGSVKVKVFARSPVRAGGQATTLSASAWRAVVNTSPTDVGAVTVDPSVLTGNQLAAVHTELSGILSHGLRPELRRDKQIRTGLKTDTTQYATLVAAESGLHGLPRRSQKALGGDLSHVTTRIGHLQRQITALVKLAAKVGVLKQATRPSLAVTVVQTDAGLSQAMTPQTGLAVSTIQPQGVPLIDADDRVRYQQFAGAGAALTDSSAWLIGAELSPTSRASLLDAVFGSAGSQNGLGVPAIHLNFLRVAIGASGAMTVSPPYSYDDLPAGQSDPTLSHFSIAHDLAYTIPTLQQALSVNPQLQILANPWSAPAWMKSNDSLDNPNGRGTLLSSDYGPFANYFVKFIQAYQAAGVPIDAITPENEPSSGQVSTAYPGMTLPEDNEAEFIAHDLSPALQAAGLHTKVYGNDLSWDSLSYATGLTSGQAAGDLSGMAWHCYFGPPTAMNELHQDASGLDQIVDECSPEIRGFGTPEFLISSLRNWASVVSVWALALDPNGGPIQPGNDCPGCTGPITINEQTGSVTFRPEYYQLGQVSAFVQPGAWRIDSQSAATYGVNSSDIETVTSGLDDVAFLNPDGSKVLVAYNNSAAPISFAVDANGSYFTYTIPAWAMTTFVWR
jgi:glucosylceramidase